MVEPPSEAAVKTRRWREEGWPLFLVLALAAIFFLSFFNRFAGIRSGDGDYGGGMAFLAGRLPYRDYFAAAPPLTQLKSAIELGLLGKTLIVSRAAGVAERLAIAALLYVWLRRSFSKTGAAIASLVTIIVSAGDRTDPVASYNHDAILFAMLCGFTASIAMDSVKTRRFLMLAAAAGAAAGLSTLTKQTVGLGTALGVLLVGVLACLSRFGVRRAALWSIAYLAGAAGPILTLALYLRHLGLLNAALQMLFVKGPAAKASHPLDFVTREIHIAIDNWVWVLLATIALLMSAKPILRSLRTPSAPVDTTRALWLRLGLAGFLVIAVAELLALTPLPAVWNFSKGPVYYAFVGTAIVGVAVIVTALRRRAGSERLWQIAILATVAWCVAATLSLSWPAFEAMTLPGLGLLLAAGVDGVRKGRPILYALLAITVFFQVREKLDLPFAFDHQDEPSVRFATGTSTLAELRGMRLPPETIRLLDETTLTMQTRASAGETVFTYPEMGILYSLSGRNPPTWAGSHNIDVVADSLAREDSLRLLQARPRVILYARPSLDQLREEEATWRHGVPSGQRDIIAALDCLVPHYQLVDTFQLKPGDNLIRLYVRPAEDSSPSPALGQCPRE
jgi:hypothetical protein